MPAFDLRTEEGKKAFDEYRFAFIDDAERHMRANRARRKRERDKFRWEMLNAQIQEKADFDRAMDELDRSVANGNIEDILKAIGNILNEEY